MKASLTTTLGLMSASVLAQTCGTIYNNSNYTLTATADMLAFPGNFCEIWNYGGGIYVDPIGSQCLGETDVLPGQTFAQCKGGNNPRAFTFIPQVGHSAYYAVLFPGDCQPTQIFAGRYTRIEAGSNVECTSGGPGGDLYCVVH